MKTIFDSGEDENNFMIVVKAAEREIEIRQADTESGFPDSVIVMSRFQVCQCMTKSWKKSPGNYMHRVAHYQQAGRDTAGVIFCSISQTAAFDAAISKWVKGGT